MKPKVGKVFWEYEIFYFYRILRMTKPLAKSTRNFAGSYYFLEVKMACVIVKFI